MKVSRTYLNLGLDDLLDYLSLKVIKENRMLDKYNDAVLMTGTTKSIIFLKQNLNSAYEYFLILHECGHRIYHFQENGRYSYIQSTYCKKLENEANVFACMYLLKGEDLTDCNIIQLLENKGVPHKIAVSFVENIPNIILND